MESLLNQELQSALLVQLLEQEQRLLEQEPVALTG
jgi:hypothetical protein